MARRLDGGMAIEFVSEDFERSWTSWKSRHSGLGGGSARKAKQILEPDAGIFIVALGQDGRLTCILAHDREPPEFEWG
jgi:hypothetical protein